MARFLISVAKFLATRNNALKPCKLSNITI